jgi:hypothetical protein
MENADYGYTEHQITEVEGFRVVDATATGPRPHDDLIWIGYDGEGRWVTAATAIKIAAAITTVATSSIMRRAHSDN